MVCAGPDMDWSIVDQSKWKVTETIYNGVQLFKAIQPLPNPNPNLTLTLTPNPIGAALAAIHIQRT